MRSIFSKIMTAAAAGFAFAALMAAPVMAATVNVTFVTPYGNYISTVEQGRSATYNGPTDVNVPGFAFCGWDVPLNCVMADTVATAVYMPIGDAKQSVDVCNVVHQAPTGILSYSTAGEHSMSTGTTLKTSPYPATPVDKPCRLTAEQSIRMNPVGVPGKTCVVKWYNGSSGELWYTDVIPYGTSAAPPEDPCITGLEFIGWDGVWTNVTQDTNIIACFYRTYHALFVCAECGEIIKDKYLRVTDDLASATASVIPHEHAYADEWDIHWVSSDKVIIIADPHDRHNDYYEDDDNHSHKYDYKKWVAKYS